MPTAINILAVDHSPIYLKGLMACFAQLPMVAKTDGCLGYQQVFEKIGKVQPHIIFLELNPANYSYDCYKLCREISSRYKNITLAVISRSSNPAIIKEAEINGAHAFFDKLVTAEMLQNFLYDFSTEGPAGYQVLLSNQRYGQSKPGNDFSSHENLLTKREREVMKLIIEGHGHHEIETMLSVTYETYKSHRANILRKLCLKNEVELTRLALNQTVCTGAGETIKLNSTSAF